MQHLYLRLGTDCGLPGRDVRKDDIVGNVWQRRRTADEVPGVADEGVAKEIVQHCVEQEAADDAPDEAAVCDSQGFQGVDSLA